MNEDARKLAEFGEQARHNRAQELADAKKADAAERSAHASMLKARASAATGIASLVGKNDADGWYDPKTADLVETGNISFVQFGTGVQRKGLGYRKVPTIIKVHMDHTLGEGSYANLVVAAKRIYDIMRGDNKGATNYTLNDVVVYLFSLLSISVHLSSYDRVIKVYESPDPVNTATIRQMVETLGFDYDDLSNNLPAIKDRLNKVKAVVNALRLPIDFPILQRWTWLTSFVFFDDTHQVKQYYVCGFDHRHTPKGTSDPHYVTRAVATPFKNSDNSAYGINEIYNDLAAIEADAVYLELNTTYQAIQGDMDHAFGESAMIMIAPYTGWNDDPYLLDEEFLCQFRNAWISPIATNAGIMSLSFMLGLKLDGDGRLGQGAYLSTGELQGLFSLLPTPIDTNWDYYKPVIFKNDNEGVYTPAQVLMTTRLEPLFGDQHQSSLTGYYYDPSDHTLKSSAITAPTNTKIAQLVACGSEVIESISFLYTDDYFNSQLPDYAQPDFSMKMTHNVINLENANQVTS